MKPDLSWPPISDVLRYYGAQPPHKGGWANMRCPFHEDTHASAAVHEENNIFYCHACCISTTGLGLIMRLEGMNQSEARSFAEEHFAGGEPAVRRPGGRSRGLSGLSGNPAGDGDALPPGLRTRSLFD